MFRLSVFQMTTLATFVVPGLVALVTKWDAHPAVKQIALIVLSALAGWLTIAVADVDYNIKQTLTLIGTQIVTATAAYFSLNHVVYDPIAKGTASVGIGPANHA